VYENLRRTFDIDVIEKETTGSTNTDAKERYSSGIRRNTLITAKTQSCGRGRQGKSFLSPDGGLYFSLLLSAEPPLPLESAVSVTSCAAVCVCRAVESFGIPCGIKWVNDIYADGKKLAGILVEAVNDYSAMTTNALVIGVGVNVTSCPLLDGDVKATSLAEHGFTASKEELCSTIVENLLVLSHDGIDFSRYLNDYRSHSLVLGNKIRYTENGVTKEATAVGIGERGELVIEENGVIRSLTSGEISVRL